MKIGTECEGRLKGIPTLFCQAEEVEAARERMRCADMKVSHIYISDNGNILDYHEVARMFMGMYITLDVTTVRTVARPANISLMLRIDGDNTYAFNEVSRLSALDQIKFERDRNVIVLPMTAAIYTMPHEFDGDVDL